MDPETVLAVVGGFLLGIVVGPWFWGAIHWTHSKSNTMQEEGEEQ
jgi:hypothetical protein